MTKRSKIRWHALCLPWPDMNDSIESGRGKGGTGLVEKLLALVLLAAISLVLAWPEGRASAKNAAASDKPALFQMTENDYLQPKFASGKGIRALNRVAGDLASFGGYDEFTSCVRVRGGMSIANVTRYSGETLSLVGADLILRDDTEAGTPHVFITEQFWNDAFDCDATVLGSDLQINGASYRIAGVTRSSPLMLGKTDIWVPLPARSSLSESACLRIIGALRIEMGWNAAQKHLVRSLGGYRAEFLEDLRGAPRLIPLERGIYFGAQQGRWLVQLPETLRLMGVRIAG
jgi:hypothetical protein